MGMSQHSSEGRGRPWCFPPAAAARPSGKQCSRMTASCGSSKTRLKVLLEEAVRASCSRSELHFPGSVQRLDT